MSLLALLEALTEGDREVDAMIGVSLGGFIIDGEQYGKPRYCRTVDGVYQQPGGSGDMLVPAYTSSLDAAVALVERCLPGYDWMLRRLRPSSHDGQTVEAALAPSVTCSDGLPKSRKKMGLWLSGRAPTPAVALCIALVKSMEAQHDRI